MKIALITDTHAGARGDSLVFNEYFMKFWENTFFPYIEKNNIKHIIHLGDVVDRRKFISFVTLNSWRTRFFDRLRSSGVTMDVIVGNHDVTYKNTNDINAMDELFHGYDNINIFTYPIEKEYDGKKVVLCPWINSGNYKESLDFLKNASAKVVFGHFDIAGFEMDRGTVSHDGLNTEIFSSFYAVYSGHFHHKSSKVNIHYLGNPYEITWADHNDNRGFHIFDTDTLDTEFIRNPYTIFHKIFYDDTNQTMEYWKDFDYSIYGNTYIKLVILNKTNAYQFDYALNNLYNVSPADLSIVEDIVDMSDNPTDIVDETEDTMTILANYVDQLTIDVDSDKLKKLLKKLYVESLEMETD